MICGKCGVEYSRKRVGDRCPETPPGTPPLADFHQWTHDDMKQKHKREAADIAAEFGFEFDSTSPSGHLRFVHPDPRVRPVPCSSSPSDANWHHSFRRVLRKATRVLTEQEQKPMTEPVENQCRYCGKDFTGEDGRKRAGHERACDDNPDAWTTCPDCSKPIKEAGLGSHRRFCKGKEEEKAKEEVEEPKKAPRSKPKPSPKKPKPSSPIRDTIRRIIVAHTTQIMDLNGRSGGEALRTAFDSVETTTDLVMEEIE